MKDDAKKVEVVDDEINLEDVEGDIEIVRFRLTGRTQLLMKSNAGVNPLNALVKQKSILTSIPPKKRTEEDIWEIYRLDFVLCMYHDEEIGPYIPGVNLEAAILSAAKMERLGGKFTAGVRIVEDRIPLQYKGPRDLNEMWKKRERFADIRPTKLKASTSLMTCRPAFDKWLIESSASFNGAIIDRAAVARCIGKIGDIGICDYRKRYGKSIVEFI